MKHTKMIIAALAALTMTACGDTGNAEETTLSESVISEAVHMEESVLTTESETDTEAETTTTAEVTNTSEITITEEITTAAEVATEVDSDGNTILKMTADTKFYECEFTDENSVTSAEELADKALFDKAVGVFKESTVYSDICEYIRVVAEEQGFTDISEYKPECRFVSAITTDFNGDSKKETAFFISVNNIAPVQTEVYMGINYFLVFADSSENIYTIDRKFSSEAQMEELKYNGFSHLVISGADSNSSQQVCIYSVQESGLKKEFDDIGSPRISKDSSLEFALRIGFPQSLTDYLIFWNNDLKCYVTPKAKHISGDEAKKIKSHMELSEEDKSGAEELDIIVIGNYYILPFSPMYCVTYEYKNGEYLRMDLVEDTEGINEARSDRDTFGVIFCDNLDLETAEKNLVKID